MRRIRSRVLTAVALSCAAGAALAAPAPAAEPEPGKERPAVSVEYFTGPHAEGRHTEVPAATPAHRAKPGAPGAGRAQSPVTALEENGPVEARLDLVVMGDGYTAAEQADFEADARAKVDEIFRIEPYKSYRGLFNIWMVHAVSNESGVSGDPTPATVRDTALSSYFWCDDIERLLCVDTDKVDHYAAQAPASDIVFVLANTTKYGGAGYNDVESPVGHDGIATMSSDNEKSALIGAHELGHSIGRLTDEYTYPSYGTYTGKEPYEANASVLDAEQQRTRRAKWWRWLGEADPAGGTVGTYEGSHYHPLGVHRPTADSLMRSLATDDFNLVGREAMIAGFYRYARAVTATTAPGTELGPDTPVHVEPARLDPAGVAALDLRWYVDGTEIPWARGRETVSPRALGVPALPGRIHTLTARATDATAALRDPAAKRSTTTTLTWTVRTPAA